MELTPAAIAQMVVTYGWPAAFGLMYWLFREESKKRDRDREEHDQIIALKDKQIIDLSERAVTGLANANQNNSLLLAILNAPGDRRK